LSIIVHRGTFVSLPETVASGDILTIRQLAEYLMVSEKTVYRMIERHQLPAVRVGAQWRFRRHDIDGWLTDEVRRVEYEGQRGVLDAFETDELAIHPLLDRQNVWLAPRPRSRDELFTLMISEAKLDAGVDREQLLRSIRDREMLCSTALVDNAAFPHPIDPRPFRFTRKRLLLAVLQEPIDYSDPHGHRPRVIAMILARSMQGYLRALSRAVKLFGDPSLAGQLAAAPDAVAAIALIRDQESRLIPKETQP
jgi:nitrogen PTS system EIIA component